MAVEGLLHTRQSSGNERQQGSPQCCSGLQAVTGGESQGREHDDHAEDAQHTQTLSTSRRQLGGIDDESAGDLTGDEGHREHGHAHHRNRRGLCDDDETAAQTAEQHPPRQCAITQQCEEVSGRAAGTGGDRKGDAGAEESDEERNERREDGMAENLTEQTVRSSLQGHRRSRSDRDETSGENRDEGRGSQTISCSWSAA